MTDGDSPDDTTQEGPGNAPQGGKNLRLLDGNRFSASDDDFDGANDEALAIRISSLEEEHRDLDAAIRALEANAPYERLSIARLKKKKLQLKDEIQTLKDAMLPDIIA